MPMVNGKKYAYKEEGIKKGDPIASGRLF